MELIGSEAELQYDIKNNNITDDDNNENNHTNDSDNEISYIPYDILTPSEEIGMSQHEEKSIRCFLMSIIQEIGIVMRINNPTVLTAINISNHFYLKQPFNLYEPIYILCASLFISGKMEENVKKPGDLLSSALYILSQKRSERDKEVDNIEIDYSHLKNFTKMKDNIYNAELVILKELAYDLHSFSFHPHCFLLHYIKKISDDANLLNHSWGLLNDMYRTSLIAHYPPNALACSAIFFASRKFYISMPKDIPWWEIFETTIQQIEEIIAETMKLYEYYSDYDLNDVRKVFKRLTYQKEREREREKIKEQNRKKHHKQRNHNHGHRHRHRHRHHHRSRSKNKGKGYNNHHYHHRDKKHNSYSTTSKNKSPSSSSLSLSSHLSDAYSK